MSVLRRRRPSTAAGTSVAAAVSRELARLDPFTFFVLSGSPFGVERVVVGSTGTFVVHVGAEAIDGSNRRELTRLKRAARRVRRQAGAASVHTSVHPVLCLPGRQFTPLVQRGVKVIPWGAVVAEVSGRSRRASPHQAQRVAQRLAAT